MHIEEPKEDLLPRTPGKKPIDNLPRGTHDLTGKTNEGVQEAPELQALDLVFLGLPPFRPWPAFGQQQTEPHLQRPGQRGHHHIGPVAHQIVGRHVHGPDSVFQLVDVVLMIAAAV